MTDPSLIVCKLSILLKTTMDQLVIHLFSFLLQKELEASYPGMFRLLWRSALPCFPSSTSPHMLLSCSWQVPTYLPTYLVKFSNPIRKLGKLSSTFLRRTWYLVALGTLLCYHDNFLGSWQKCTLQCPMFRSSNYFEQGRKRNCSELFRPAITDSGICCAFNLNTDLKDSMYKKMVDEMKVFGKSE